jgi:NAD(P)-dependent dehydrogenase (short-subunit alcohol dehydrogenase family)
MADEKVAVVTGSSSGIGLLTVIELALGGYRVVATMRDLGRKQRLVEAAQKAGVARRLDLRRLDITEFESLPGAVEAMVRDHGRIDVLVNNAGFSSGGFGEDMSLAEIRDQLETNFFGNVAMTKAALPAMRKQRRGHIIQISSVAGRAPAPVVGAYGASKFALEGWSEALRIETYSLGIRVVLIEPGVFDTDIWTRNVKVSAGAVDPNSPNKERSQRFTKFVKHGAEKRRDPRQVARQIVRVANDPNPKLRYVVGWDARVQLLFRSLAPWRVYERVLARLMKID